MAAQSPQPLVLLSPGTVGSSSHGLMSLLTTKCLPETIQVPFITKNITEHPTLAASLAARG